MGVKGGEEIISGLSNGLGAFLFGHGRWVFGVWRIMSVNQGSLIASFTLYSYIERVNEVPNQRV